MQAFNRLSARAVAQLQTPGRYPDGLGLYLQITRTGSKSWIFRYARNGRERYMGLGPCHTVTLAEARERARQARLQHNDGKDPLAEKKAMRAATALEEARSITFEEAANAYYREHHMRWKNAKSAQFLSSLKAYAFPLLGKLAVSDIDTGLILRVLKPIWNETPETATRVRRRIEWVLGWATVHGYRTGDNPAQWRGHLATALPKRNDIKKTVHHRALPWGEAPAFFADLKNRKAVAARALEFTMLTAARTGEVIGATWDEIDEEKGIWTVPAERMKAGKEHQVPLSEEALALLRQLPREKGNPYVFISGEGKGLSNMAMARLLDRMGRKDITVHGMRSTFRDWAAETTSYPNHVAEMALAHVVRGVEGDYRRGNLFTKRARMMQDWAGYLSKPRADADNVTPIRKRKIARYRPESLPAV